MKEKQTYSEAIQRLEQIVNQIQNGNTDIDLLTKQLEEAKDLIAFCRKKLLKTKTEAEKIFAQMDTENQS